LVSNEKKIKSQCRRNLFHLDSRLAYCEEWSVAWHGMAWLGMARKMGVINKNVTAEKSLALVPKKTRVDWSAARKMHVALLPK
jgi:hypothetical protein